MAKAKKKVITTQKTIFIGEDETFYENIRTRFAFNIERVQNLCDIYLAVGKLKLRAGRKYKADILRAAVVLLHASFEDAIRNLLLWRLPSVDAELIAGIPFSLSKTTEAKLTLSDLVANYRDWGVDNILKDAISQFLLDHNISDTTVLACDLRKLTVNVELYKKYFPVLGVAIARRHQIVHRSDRNEADGPNHGKPVVIQLTDVETWKRTVNEFIHQLFDEFNDTYNTGIPTARSSQKASSAE